MVECGGSWVSGEDPGEDRVDVFGVVGEVEGMLLVGLDLIHKHQQVVADERDCAVEAHPIRDASHVRRATPQRSAGTSPDRHAMSRPTTPRRAA